MLFIHLLIILVFLYFTFLIIHLLANGIPILPFYDNPDDSELQDLTTYLIKLAPYDDIAKINSVVFKLNDYHKFMNPV